jgi:hypothetical protein
VQASITPSTPCDFLMIVSDAIDQSHWCLPRHPGLRSVKSLASYRRPVVCVLCVWIVGFLLRFFVLDQDQAHDASCVAECVARALEEVNDILRASGRTMPPCVIYWVSEAALSTPPCDTRMGMSPNLETTKFSVDGKRCMQVQTILRCSIPSFLWLQDPCHSE